MENGSCDSEDGDSRFSSDLAGLPWMEEESRLRQAGTRDILTLRDGSCTPIEDGLIISEDMEEEEFISSGWTGEEESSEVKIYLVL